MTSLLHKTCSVSSKHMFFQKYSDSSVRAERGRPARKLDVSLPAEVMDIKVSIC